MTGWSDEEKMPAAYLVKAMRLQQLTAQTAQLDERLQKTEKQVQHFETVTKDAQAALEELRTTGETASNDGTRTKNQLQNPHQRVGTVEKRAASL